ncbi:unnamed protein product [Symbiodinium natans]|uniref:Uncharacterized protein n=1 Tax=Symbiodinium natans TaxID=878477 RepID=A0A812HRN1_9DINO|nr:unnamed protein product [Symbiodinium natans]
MGPAILPRSHRAGSQECQAPSPTQRCHRMTAPDTVPPRSMQQLLSTTVKKFGSDPILAILLLSQPCSHLRIQVLESTRAFAALAFAVPRACVPLAERGGACFGAVFRDLEDDGRVLETRSSCQRLVSSRARRST